MYNIRQTNSRIVRFERLRDTISNHRLQYHIDHSSVNFTLCPKKEKRHKTCSPRVFQRQKAFRFKSVN